MLAGTTGSGVVVARLPPTSEDVKSTATSANNNTVATSTDAIATIPNPTIPSRWSPPSFITLRSAGLGLVYGVDVYDCVIVLNTASALSAYSEPNAEVKLGGGLALAAGPANIGGAATAASDERETMVYTRSRGLYGGVSVEGTVVKEDRRANEEFYGIKGLTSRGILGGEVGVLQGGEDDGHGKRTGKGKWPMGAKGLIDVLERV